MTIQTLTDRARGRLWSGLSTDPKPTGWAPGIMLLEIDTGVWCYTDANSEWKACHPTLAQHQVLMDRAAALELDVEAKAVTIATMQSELAAVRATLKQAETAIADLKKGR